jgi:hypothetical protein
MTRKQPLRFMPSRSFLRVCIAWTAAHWGAGVTTGSSDMSSKGERERITISISSDENVLIIEERNRTGESFSGAIIRLAKLGLEQQAQAEAARVTVAEAARHDEPVALLTVHSSTSTDIVPAPAAAMSVITPVPAPAARTVIEPTPTGALPAMRQQRQKPWWTPTALGEAPNGSEKARWSAVGVLSAVLALMLVPGNGMVAAAVSQTVLGEPGDGIAASNLLFERYSNRAGPRRHWEATARVADNQARVKACADRADRFSDYRRLAACEIHVSSRRRAIEVGQGIVD